MFGISIKWVCGLMAIGLLAFAAGAEAKSNADLQAKFNTPASRKAYPNLERAMTMPMAELVDKATEFNPPYVLSYALALELGRPPETLTDRQGQRVSGAFQSFLDIFLRSSDKIALQGNERALLNMPDFWIILSKNLARRENKNTNIFAGSTTTGSGWGPGMSFTVSDISGTGLKESYNLKGDKILDVYMVYAAQSCAIYAKSNEQMKVIQRVDASELAHLSPEEQANTRTEAVRIYRAVNRLGPQACGSAEYFAQTSAYVAPLIGKLATMKLDPNIPLATLTPDAGVNKP